VAAEMVSGSSELARHTVGPTTGQLAPEADVERVIETGCLGIAQHAERQRFSLAVDGRGDRPSTSGNNAGATSRNATRTLATPGALVCGSRDRAEVLGDEGGGPQRSWTRGSSTVGDFRIRYLTESSDRSAARRS
jgi:hypothetical protein